MNSIIIDKIVNEQMAEKGIYDSNIFILEKDWGYVVQVICSRDKIYFNEVFDREANIICPLGVFNYDSGSVYRTEIKEKTDKFGRKEVFAYEPSVRFKQLDENHFIIPRNNESIQGNMLFFIDEANHVTYKGFIKGKIFGNILTENRRLLESKQLLVYEDTDKINNEYDNYFYSWEKNCRTSDKWDFLYSSDATFNIRDFLYNQMKELPKELVNEIIFYVQEQESWFAILKLNAVDNYQYCIALIGINGLPLTDLIYITPQYEVKTYQLKKEKIGEVDYIKQELKEQMEKRHLEIEENKKNMVSNFFKTVGLTMNAPKTLTLEEQKN